MFNKESQYVSIVKYNNQLKVDYKKLDDGKTAFGKESTFIIYDKVLPKDIATKLNLWQKEVRKTYLSTLCVDKHEQIVSKRESKKVNKASIVASLNSQFDVVMDKVAVENTKDYFALTGVDYVFSPFHILNLYLELNPSKNSLLLLTINNYAYILITDNKSEIIDHKIAELSTFKEIQDSEFFESDVVGQKLFDEIYYLQLQEAINGAVKDFYNLQNDNFIEKVNVLYSQKQLNDSQIDALNEELMIDINYHNISIKEALFEIAKSDNAAQKSLTRPRKKRSKFLRNFILVILFLGAVIGGGYTLFEKEVKTFIEEQEVKKETIIKKKEEVVKKRPDLPNHHAKNAMLEKEVMELFSMIPIDAVLERLELKNNNSIFALKLLKEDTYIKAIQPKILEVYKYSNIQFKGPKSTIIEATIYNNEKIVKKQEKIALPKYKIEDFKPIKRVTEQLKLSFPKDAIVRYKSSFKSEVTTYNYEVVMVITSPQQFYDVVKRFNTLALSVHINYPVNFVKVEDGVEVTFAVQYHQNH